MIYTRCPNCHKRISIQDKCDCRKIDKAKVKNGNAQLHDNYYKTSDWLIARDKTISSCHGLDIYSLLIDHKIEYGQTVHHIVPLEEDYSKRDDLSNLISATEMFKKSNVNVTNLNQIVKSGLNNLIMADSMLEDYKNLTTFITDGCADIVAMNRMFAGNENLTTVVFNNACDDVEELEETFLNCTSL